MRPGLGPLLIVGVSCAAWALPLGASRAAEPPPSGGAASVGSASTAGSAQTSTPTPTTEAKAAAQEHFTRAKDLYASGKYPDALAELQQAHGLDPSAKDLVFNLGLVEEKLARFDDALRYYRLYLTMAGVTEAEKARAEAYIKRVDGAKRALPPPTPSASATQAPPPEKPEKKRGRVDAATISAAAIGVAGLGVGGVFGVKALGDAPPSNVTTSKTNTYASNQAQQDTAHKEAFVADLGFAIGGAGVLAAAILYLAREKDKPGTAPKTSLGPARITGMGTAPTERGAAVFLGGEF